MLKDNKAAQTIVGAFVLYVLFVLWREGWFASSEDAEGFSGPEVWLAIGSAILSFVQLVGLITISISLKLIPAFEVMAEFISKSLQKAVEKSKTYVLSSKTESGWDWRPLAAVILSWMLWSGGQLSSIWDRIVNTVPDAIDVITDKPIGILFSVDEETSVGNQWAIANSLTTERILSNKGIERRLLSSDQDAGSSEPWVFEAVEKAPDGANSMVIYYPDGRSVVQEMPKDFDTLKRLVSAW